MNNPYPPATKRAIQFFALLIILFWATQILMHQWGYGAEPPAANAATASDDAINAARDETPVPPQQRLAIGDSGENQPASQPTEKFVPGSNRFLAGATLELRGDATVLSGDVHLRQICRWSQSDAAAFDPIADLVLLRIDSHAPYRAFTLTELKRTLSDAGINLAVVRFAGATSCTIHREDVAYDEHAALRQWIEAQQNGSPTGSPTTQQSASQQETASPAPGASPKSAAALHAAPESGIAGALTAGSVPPVKTYHALRDLITTDLAERLELSVDSLEIHFNPADDKVLSLSEPQFRFNLVARRAANLGDIAYDIEIVTDHGTQKTTIAANARAWEQQLVVNKPMTAKQVIRDEDLLDRRVLVDRLIDHSPITREQAVGQATARQLEAGTILSARMVEPLPLVRMGQLVTVTIQQGGVQIKTVARALDAGSYGQTVRVRNETTNEIFEVICTGPQEVRLPSASDSGGQGISTASLDRN